MYYLDFSNQEIITLTTKRVNTNCYFLYTVNSKMDYFTRAYIEGSYRSLYLQHLLGWPSDQQLINALSNNFIINYRVLSDGVRRAHAIYGPAAAILKVKMVMKKTKHVELKQHISVQAEILKYHP